MSLALALAVAGTILSVDGAPVPGARVTVQAPNMPPVATVSGPSGEFSFPNVELPADIEVMMAGFAPVRQRLTAGSQSVRIILAPAAVRESIVVDSDPPITSVWHDQETGSTILTGADVRAMPAVTPDEALRVVSGFSLFRRSASRASNPTTHGVTMRGLSASGASRGLVLIDGVPLNEGFGSWVTWTRLPNDAISSLRIDRGAGGDAFGSDALGGVIRLESSQRGPVTVSAELGSRDQRATSASAGLGRGNVSVFGAASWFRTDGVIPTAPESRGEVDVPADAEWFNGFARAVVSSDSKRFTVTAFGGSDDRGNGTVVQRNTMTGGTVAASFDTATAATVFAARLSYSPNSFDQTFSQVFTGRNAESLTSTQSVETRMTRGIVEVGRMIPRGYLMARVGLVRGSAEFTDVRPTNPVDRDLVDVSEAISLHANMNPHARVTVTGGVRQEWRQAPNDGGDRARATVGHLQGAVQVAPSVTIRSAVATSHRWPTLNELVRNFQVGAVLTQANEALEPERALSTDVVLAVERARWGASAGYFWTRIDDAVANVTTQTTPSIIRQRRNAGEAHAKGLELDGEARLIARLRIRGSLTVTQARFRDSAEPALEGNRLPQVPRVAGSVWADVMLPRAISASAIWRGVGRQFDDDRNQFELQPGYQFDIRIAGMIQHLGWAVTGENLFDNRVEVGRTPLVTLAPGRAGRVSLQWKF